MVAPPFESPLLGQQLLHHHHHHVPTAPSNPRPRQAIDRQSIALRQGRVFVQPIDATDHAGLESNDGSHYLSTSSPSEHQLQLVSGSTPHNNSVVGNNNSKVGKRVVFLLDEATTSTRDEAISGGAISKANSTGSGGNYDTPDARLAATAYQFDDSILCDDSTEHTYATRDSDASVHSVQTRQTRQQFADVLLLESRKTAQDVFIQKFWQLKMAVTACQTPYSCHEALLHSPARYGLVLLSQRDLVLHGLQESLRLVIPSEEADRQHCAVVVHGAAGAMSDADLRVLEDFGVDGVLSEPFSLKALKVGW